MLRNKLMARIDALLARGFLVRGEDRDLLTALRGYAASMSADDLKKLSAFMVRASYTRRRSHVMSEELISLPTDPASAVKAVRVIVNHLRKIETQPWDELAHCALHLQGYALGFVHRHPPVVFAECPCPPDDEGKAALLEKFLLPRPTAEGMISVAATEIPWKTILRIALEMAMRWLDG